MSINVPKWRTKPIPCNRCGKDNWRNMSGSCAVCTAANEMEFCYAMNWPLPVDYSESVQKYIGEEKAFLEEKFSKTVL